jgi:hydrogenase-4 component B
VALELVLIAALIAAASGLPALALPRRSAWGGRASAALLALAAACGISGAFMGMLGEAPPPLEIGWPAAGGALVGLDPLSSFFLVPVFLVGALGAIYGLGYFPAAENPRTARRLHLFYGLLVAGMAFLLVARQAFAFLLGWETMALAGFFLIALEDQKEESRRSSLVYLVATHVSTLTLFGMFLLWRGATGSFDLEPSQAMGLGAATGIFLLALVGFGLKAGVMPLHFWLPGAHAAAPSQVSALLSGVVLKMGIYGLVRMLSLLPWTPAAWGVLVLVLGGASALFGVAFALAQHDLKKLLAYHSVENIGIILMGLGTAMLGRACGLPGLVALGMAGCLLHVWNHSLFKSLLFLGAGSVLRATGTRAIDRLGGLGKAMPWTAALFIAGAVAICGLPPLNGFVSELLVYLGLFHGLVLDGPGLALAAAAAPALAMVGALAVACFVKVVGVSFLGAARSPEAERAAESPASMLLPMGIIAVLCVFIGVAPRFLAPLLDAAVAAWNGPAAAASAAAGPLAAVAAGLAPLPAALPVPSLFDIAPLGEVGLASAGLLLIISLAALLFGRSAGRARSEAAGRPTWDCGYAAPTARMQYTSSSFARGIVGMFAWLLRPPAEPRRLEGYYPGHAELRGEVREAVLDRVLMPAFRRLSRVSAWFHRFQQGLTQQYVLYILVALVALLATLVPFDSLFAALAGGRP